MLNDYKPTHDPNLDTFKVQYLLGASAVLAILFPYKYTFSEVRDTHLLPHTKWVPGNGKLIRLYRSSGPSPSGSSLSPSYPNFSCCNAQAKPKL